MACAQLQGNIPTHVESLIRCVHTFDKIMQFSFHGFVHTCIICLHGVSCSMIPFHKTSVVYKGQQIRIKSFWKFCDTKWKPEF